jgi:hypothetical protein
MNKFSHALIAVPVLLATMLSACGGGGGSGSALKNQQMPGIAVGEPSPNTKLDTAEFVVMARSASCAGLSNRLLVIDETQVLWDRAGNCADNSYGQTLFGNNSKTALCSVSDTIAGPRTVCNDDKYKDEFATILKNLDKADLGLGASHTVRAVEFLAANGSQLAFESLSSGIFSGVQAAQKVVIKDKAAFTKLWADTHKNASNALALPEIDFGSTMVIGVYQGEQPNACQTSRITKVAVAGDKIVVNYSDHDNLIAMTCIQAITSPYTLVTVKRSAAEVEFVNITNDKLFFQEIDHNTVSGIDTPQNLVIKDESSWAKVWERHAGKDSKLPEVDFSKFMVVGVFLGQQSDGCHDTEIVSIDHHGSTVNVTHRDKVPGPLVRCIMMMTAPAHIVMVERAEGAVEFSADPFML